MFAFFSASTSGIGPRLIPSSLSGAFDPTRKAVEAPKGGTKWHKDQPKQWFEAKTDDGHTYYWHVDTHESRWEASLVQSDLIFRVFIKSRFFL